MLSLYFYTMLLYNVFVFFENKQKLTCQIVPISHDLLQMDESFQVTPFVIAPVEESCEVTRVELEESFEVIPVEEDVVIETLPKSPIKCQKCSYKTNRRYNLTRHEKKIHSSNQRPPPTPGSSSRFLCHVCGGAFSRNFTLKRHQQQIHSTGPPQPQLPCHICGKTFSSKQKLARHLATHKIQDNTGGTESTQVKPKVPCRFTKCKHLFSKKSNMERHYLSAHKGKLFSCAHCNKTFKTKAGRAKHFAKHHSEKVAVKK